MRWCLSGFVVVCLCLGVGCLCLLSVTWVCDLC